MPICAIVDDMHVACQTGVCSAVALVLTTSLGTATMDAEGMQ